MQREQRAHHLHAVAAAVHEIAVEDVLVALAGQPRGLQNVEQIRQLACVLKK